MDSTARLPLQSPVPFPCHRDLGRDGDFLGEAAMQRNRSLGCAGGSGAMGRLSAHNLPTATHDSKSHVGQAIVQLANLLKQSTLFAALIQEPA